MLRRFMAEFFSRSALRMFLLEKSSHSSGATELKQQQKKKLVKEKQNLTN